MHRLPAIAVVSAALVSCSFSYSGGSPNAAPAVGGKVASKPARPSGAGRPARPSASEPPATAPPASTPPSTRPGGSTPPVRPPAPEGPADIVFYGGPVVTMRTNAAGQPLVVDALAVKDGKILRVGSLDEVMRVVTDATRRHDLSGKTLLPGFIDAHGHLSRVAAGFEQVRLASPPVGSVRSIPDLQKLLRDDIARRKLTGGEWLIGWNYDDSQLREHRHPTRDDLDKVSRIHAILLYHVSGEIAAANSVALRLLGITPESTDPAGGQIRRKPGTKIPDGVLIGTVLADIAPKLPQLSDDALAGLLERAERDYASRGYTTVQDGAVDQQELAALKHLARQRKHVIDVVAYPRVETVADARALEDQRFGAYTGGLKLGGIKLMLDGTPETRTAWLSRPYAAVAPGQPRGWRGEPRMREQDLEQILDLAVEHDWQVLAHANGDAAAEQFLDAWERVRERRDVKGARPVLVHAQLIREDQLERLRGLGVIPSFAVSHGYYWGDLNRDQVLGRERAERQNPVRSAVDRNLRFTLQDDAPTVPPDPMLLVSSAVNRITRSGQVLGADQRVLAFDALRGVTTYGAYQYFEEADKGTLTPGDVADMVILDNNPLSVRSARLKDIGVLATYKAGAPVYEARPPK